jgi:hypothetical protein
MHKAIIPALKARLSTLGCLLSPFVIKPSLSMPNKEEGLSGSSGLLRAVSGSSFSSPRMPCKLSLPSFGSNQSSFFAPAPASYLDAILNGQAVKFEVHATGGEGHCGFYGLPIAHDREGAKALLLGAQDNAAIRALVAPEIRDAILSGQLPAAFPRRAEYEEWCTDYFQITSAIDALNAQVIARLEVEGHTLPSERTPRNMLATLEALSPQPK